MNLTLFGAIALMAFVSDSNGEIGGLGGGGGGFGGPAAFGGGPAAFGGPAGFAGLFGPPPAATAAKMAGQDASKNAIDLAVNSAMSKINVTELSPELQEELQQAVLDTEYGMLQCDQFVEFWNLWRNKICRIQEFLRLKFKIQEIKLKAAELATSTTTQASTTSSTSTTFQSTGNAPSTASAA